MKKQTLLMVLTVASAILIVSCSKKGSVDDVPVNKNIYGRVVEMGTDLPISGAEFITSTCASYDNVFGCGGWKKASVFTSSYGKFNISRENFRNHRLEKNGYWSYVNEPDRGGVFGNYINYQPAPVIYYSTSPTSQLDSLLIKLFPINNISIKVRNSGVQTEAILRCIANLYGTSGHNIVLRAGIDSSFQYPVFGNTENKIFIYRNSPLNDTTSTQMRYIAKNETLSLDISY